MKSSASVLSKKLFSALAEEHSGVGGLYFITINIACAFILTITLQLSWTSQVVAMADNLAYITAVNTAAYSYVGGEAPYTSTNPLIYVDSTNSYYSPLANFNKMLSDSGLKTSNVSTCIVTWNGSKASVRFSYFKTILGVEVNPHQQEAVIESY